MTGQKLAGRNITKSVYPGKGTVINADRKRTGVVVGACDDCSLPGFACPHSASISIKFDEGDLDDNDFFEFINAGETDGISFAYYDNGDGNHFIYAYGWTSGYVEFEIPDSEFFGVYHECCARLSVDGEEVSVTVTVDGVSDSFLMDTPSSRIDTIRAGVISGSDSAHRTIQCVKLLSNPDSAEEDFSFPADSWDSFTGGASIVGGLLRIDSDSGDAYASKTLALGYDLICADCCPGCVSFSLDATVTMSCTVEGEVICNGTGSVDFASPTLCQYDGGCNTDCSSMPVFVHLRHFSGAWYILIVIDAAGVCEFQDPPNPPVNNQFCTQVGGVCDYVELTSECSPDGTYSIDVPNENPSTPDTCNLSFILAQQSGACCDAFDACTQQNESCCDDAGGTFHGYGTSCDPNPCIEATGACCTLGGDCDITTETLCGVIGGTYQGDGTTCSPDPCGGGGPTGACCFGAACSGGLTEADCVEFGGVYAGDGVTCAENPCA